MLFPSEVSHSIRGRLLQSQPLADYTSWRVGGMADYVFIPADLEDLKLFLEHLPSSIPLSWLGLGSNVLIRDGGVDGVVIVTQGALQEIELLEDGLVRAEAGVACAQLARYTARLGLAGIEFMAGIPGTVGGALKMNAGCYGGETWQYVHQVETITSKGNVVFHPARDFEFSYRHVTLPPAEWFVAGYFSLQKGDKAESLKKIKNLLEKRNQSQPTGQPNCGSVFRNPPGNFSAKLIEQSGLKGKQRGRARVSEKHANFIINEGGATAEDIEGLIGEIASIVEEQHGVRLVTEVCMMGKPKR